MKWTIHKCTRTKHLLFSCTFLEHQLVDWGYRKLPLIRWSNVESCGWLTEWWWWLLILIILQRDTHINSSSSFTDKKPWRLPLQLVNYSREWVDHDGGLLMKRRIEEQFNCLKAVQLTHLGEHFLIVISTFYHLQVSEPLLNFTRKNISGW